MSTKIVFFALLCAAATTVSAQSINLGFPGDGDRQIWIAPTLASQPPSDSEGVRTTKSDATLPIGVQKDSASVFVWDRKVGNIATKSIKDAKVATWEVKPGDFQTVAQITVRVGHDGKPVAAATIDLDDGQHKASQLLDPSCKGEVSFFGIKPGSVKVTVHYKVAGKDAQPITQLLDVAIVRSTPIPVSSIALADAVETIGSTATGTTNTTASPSGESKEGTQAIGSKSEGTKSGSSGGVGSFVGSAIIYIIVLGGMAALIYYAVLYAKRNPDSVGSKLEQLGVQIPKPGDDPLTDPSQMPVPGRPAPMPVQKIILDDAAPDPLSPISPFPSSAANSGFFDPRLVGLSGDAMPIPEGELVVGREIGLGLSLVGESTVSRKHAQLMRNGSQVTVKDFGSTNGTFVNGVQVQGEKQLQAGDTVQFGSVRFRFEG